MIKYEVIGPSEGGTITHRKVSITPEIPFGNKYRLRDILGINRESGFLMMVGYDIQEGEGWMPFQYLRFDSGKIWRDANDQLIPG